jgi:uncharacterized membrane protein
MPSHSAISMLLVAAALYALFMAVNKLLRAAAAIAAAAVIAGHLTNPQDPFYLARSLWEASQPAIARIGEALLAVWRTLWQAVPQH